MRESNPNRIGDRSLALWSDGEADWTPGMTVVGRPRGIFSLPLLYRLNWDGPAVTPMDGTAVPIGKTPQGIARDLKHGTG
jgi:hypothetical protein